jgi:hypothetical protein
LATLVLLTRNRYYATLYASEEDDADHDGVPDVYQTPEGEARAAAEDAAAHYTADEAGRTDSTPDSANPDSQSGQVPKPHGRPEGDSPGSKTEN